MERPTPSPVHRLVMHAIELARTGDLDEADAEGLARLMRPRSVRKALAVLCGRRWAMAVAFGDLGDAEALAEVLDVSEQEAKRALGDAPWGREKALAAVAALEGVVTRTIRIGIEDYRWDEAVARRFAERRHQSREPLAAEISAEPKP